MQAFDVDIGGYTGGSEDHLIGKTEYFITREVTSTERQNENIPSLA